MTKEETLILALEALEVLIDSFADVSAYEDKEHAFTNELIFIPDIKKAIKAITAIKEALAQPAQATSGWGLRYVYFDEDGIPLMYREPEGRNFCPRCGKRTADLTTIHTCTPPRENT
jgi:hypothetical protein